ncbi:bile acid:sodium symporter family protein [Desulfosporosinus lacus]|uniref:Predicted Na+-dependent transporter n=1 Tax=Desulfosporosinus lacus DSM 15449 TaxID=1121420 RepID=A0A1M5Y5Y5_9FIRM|nr:bile acid:sodium symporter [Desulfosporosinus lacus]SHI07485.1 Predicted Na+-dependent transporter [Desulfosporosinus lacus DSM 15449]
MQTFLTKFNQWLNRYMFVMVTAGIAVGFFIPLINSPLISALATGLFAYMTFMSALRTTFQDVVRILTKPLVPLWSMFLIHGISPLVAWGVGLWIYPDNFYMRLGLLLGSTIPIAVTSVIWTTIANGDIALALVTVTLDTLLIPILFPAFFIIILGTSIAIDYGNMVLRLLLMVTIPSILGMVINEITKGRLENFSVSVGGVTSKIASFFVVFLNSAVVLPNIKWDISAVKMMIVVVGLVSANYLIGFCGSYLLKDRRQEVVTAMIFNVGMRNTGFGSVIAISYFPATVALPIVLTLLFQQPIAAVVSKAIMKFNHQDRIIRPEEGTLTRSS